MDNQNEYINTWGLCLYVTDPSKLHPDDDFETFKYTGGQIFECQDITDDGYLLLVNHDYRFRVKPDNYEKIPYLSFRLGNQVGIKKYPNKSAIVVKIGWHEKRSEAMYYLEINGKRSSRTYWADELETMFETK